MQLPEDTVYIRKNYDVKIVCGGMQFFDRSPLGRMRNAVVQAMRRYSRLPRMIIFVIEDDVINDIRYSGYGIRTVYG